MTETFKQGIIAEVKCIWSAYNDKEAYDNDMYQFVDDGEYEKYAFLDWFQNESRLPDIEDIIYNATRIQQIRDLYFEINL